MRKLQEILEKIQPQTKSKWEWQILPELKMPVWVVKGNQSGKVLAISAGVHGCEYVGIAAVKRAFESLDADKISGMILFFPLINAAGFYQGKKQIMPLDEERKNLNRIFPGKRDGTLAERLAHRLEEQLYPEIDFLLDLHGGDIDEDMQDLLFFSENVSKTVRDVAENIASCMPIPYRLCSQAENGFYSRAAKMGTPALLLEIGSGGKFCDEEVIRCLECIEVAQRALGIVQGEVSVNQEQKCSQRTEYVFAASDGFWHRMAKAGDRVKKGDVLGEIKSLEDVLLQRVIAKFDGVVWYGQTGFGVSSQTHLLAYGAEE